MEFSIIRKQRKPINSQFIFRYISNVIKIDMYVFENIMLHSNLGLIGDVPVMLAKPQTFMNASGESVSEITLLQLEISCSC